VVGVFAPEVRLDRVEAPPLLRFLGGVWGRGCCCCWRNCSSCCCSCSGGGCGGYCWWRCDRGGCVDGGGVLPGVSCVGVVVVCGIGIPEEDPGFADGGYGGIGFWEGAPGFEDGWAMDFLEEPFVFEDPFVLEGWFLDKGHILR
jgi:hypothetical protein